MNGGAGAWCCFAGPVLGRILVAPSSQRRLPGLDICTDWQLRGHGASARNLDTTG